jgi:hypothetical protein
VRPEDARAEPRGDARYGERARQPLLDARAERLASSWHSSLVRDSAHFLISFLRGFQLPINFDHFPPP